MTVEPGCHAIKNPATISLGRSEQPERVATLARLTGVGLLVYGMIHGQVRLSLLTHDQPVSATPGRPRHRLQRRCSRCPQASPSCTHEWAIGRCCRSMAYSLITDWSVARLASPMSGYEAPSANTNGRGILTLEHGVC